MIVGLGLDVVSVSSFAALLATEASAFARDTFTKAELAYAQGEALGAPAQHLAARYAAKEAALKALDQAAGAAGVDPPVLSLTDLEVVRDARGRPALAFHGEADAFADATGANRALLTLSHDADVAAAVVILERLAH